MSSKKQEKFNMSLYWLLTEVFILLDDADRKNLRQFNLSVPKFNALYHLEQNKGISINDLTLRLICDKSNTTRLIDRLKQEGLVFREQDQKDRRYVSITLTEDGRNLRDMAVTSHQDSVKERMEILTLEEQKTLSKLLTQLRDGLRDYITKIET